MSPSPSVSSSTRVVPDLVGWGKHHIQMPFVLDSTVLPNANPDNDNDFYACNVIHLKCMMFILSLL